jgi:alpha-mannosidase
MQALVQGLVAGGQLTFAGGSFVMHDEAATTYNDMVRQTTLGARFLQQQFNYSVTTAWQIDPFGHSGVQASLFSSPLLGMDAVYFVRVSYEEFAARSANKTLEMVWQASPSLPELQTFAGIMYGGYGPPALLDFDYSALFPLPINDDPALLDNNVAEMVDIFVANAQIQAPAYQGDIAFYEGFDFNYETAGTIFKNLDKLIHYVNLDGRVNTFYSTPDMYTAAKMATPNVTWPVKANSDFFRELPVLMMAAGG